MNRITKTLLALAGIAAVLAGLALVFQKQVATRLLQEMVDRNAGRDILPSLPDGLHLALCGTGSPFPDPTRAGPCSAIIAGDRLFIVDAGEGSARTLSYMGIPAGRIEAIFLTHFHSDHIDGLPPLMLQRWGTSSALMPTPIHGPTGVDKVVDGFRAAYGLDFGYRIAHHTERILRPGSSGGTGVPFALPAAGQGDQVVVMDDKGLKVTAFRVNHAPVEPAVGYRFDYKGRSIVISGDTVASPSLVAAAKGADILLHEALQPKLLKLLESHFEARKMEQLTHVMRDIVSYHTTPEQAAAQASAAGVKQLVFNHVVPPMPLSFAYPAFMGDAKDFYKGPMLVGEDGMLFSLPADSTDSTSRRLF